MKILHINANYVVRPLHQTMMKHFDSTVVENYVFAPTYNADLSCVMPDENVVLSQCFRKWDRVIFDYKQKKIIDAVEQNFDIDSFDCIHAYTLFTDGNCAMNLSEKFGIPYVVAVRSTDLNSFLKYRVHLRRRAVEILRGASAVFFLSESYRQKMFEKYIPEQYKDEIYQKVYIVPNGIDDFWHENAVTKILPERYQRILGKHLRLLEVSQLDKNKNCIAIIKAAEILIRNGWDVKLTLVGKTVDKRIEKKIIAKSFVQHIEAVPKEKLMEYYRENDIFVMPSFSETFGLVYVEALTQGLPVIYSQGQGFDSQFPEGEVGFHVNASSFESLANAILAVAENYKTISEGLMGKTKKFTWENICRQYVEIYQNII